VSAPLDKAPQLAGNLDAVCSQSQFHNSTVADP
jgi:hypothetical protein